MAGQITVAAIDPFRGYADALRSPLPDATLVVDHFHAVRLANSASDDVRRRTQQDVLGHRGRKGDPLYGIRRLPLLSSERLSERRWARIHAALAAGDPTTSSPPPYRPKNTCAACTPPTASPPPVTARRQLRAFYKYCADVEVDEFTRLAKTVTAWEAEILAYRRTSLASNRPTEAVDLLVETVRRTGFGFRNFDNYRLRLLLSCGTKWHTPVPARIRSRKPGLVA